MLYRRQHVARPLGPVRTPGPREVSCSLVWHITFWDSSDIIFHAETIRTHPSPKYCYLPVKKNPHKKKQDHLPKQQEKIYKSPCSQHLLINLSCQWALDCGPVMFIYMFISSQLSGQPRTVMKFLTPLSPQNTRKLQSSDWSHHIHTMWWHNYYNCTSQLFFTWVHY